MHEGQGALCGRWVSSLAGWWCPRQSLALCFLSRQGFTWIGNKLIVCFYHLGESQQSYFH